MAHGHGAECSWHSGTPAQWNCTQCHKLYCKSCSPQPPPSQGEHRCTLCHRDLKFLGAAHAAPPFWQRLNAFFIYPFHSQTMAFLFITSLLGVTLSSGGIFSGLMSLLLTVCITKYTYKIIEYMSNGRRTPPSVAEAFSGEGFDLFFKQMAVFIVIGIALGVIGWFGSVWFLIPSLLFIVLALPASVMVLARENSLPDAIHPGRLFGVMRAIGWPYFLLFFFVLTLYSAPGALLALLSTKLSANILLPISLFAGSYFTCVTSALMGYCLFQYQDLLGYTAGNEEDEESNSNESNWLYEKALADSAINFQEGRIHDCADALKEGLKHRPKDQELNRRLFELRSIGSDTELMTREAELYLQSLADKQQYSAAADALTAVRNRLKDWKPESPESCYVTAKGFIARGRYKETILLLKGLHVRAPEYRRLPEAYLVMAQALSDGLQRDNDALKLLDYIQKKYPNNAVSGEIDRLASVLSHQTA